MKYTFEIMKEYEDAFKGISVYSVSEDKKLMVDFVALEELEDAQKEINEAYQRGLEDAWETAKKVALCADEGGLSIEELNEIFGCCTIQQVFRRYTVSETIAKLKAYEEKQKEEDFIKVDDEVEHEVTGLKYIVTRIDKNSITLLYSDGSTTVVTTGKSYLKKTGRRFDIEKILEEMKK